MAANEFMPDWAKVWTKEVAEVQFEGFKFNGPGWYFYTEDTILVLPTNDPVRFQFNVYHERNPLKHFDYIVNAPQQYT